MDITLFEGRPAALIEKVLERVAGILCEGLQMERGNAFITVREGKSGQVYSGGSIVRK